MATPGYTEADFQYLRALFPNRDDEAGSRLAYCAVLRESADVQHTMSLLWDGARQYAAHVIEHSTLAQFIESGLWRPQPDAGTADLFME